MTDEVKVRVGTPEDLDGIMNLAINVAKENGVFAPDIHKVLSEVWPSLHQHLGIVGVIGEVGKPLEGFVLLRVGQQWYNSNNILEERVVFVEKKFRSAKGGRARKLCEFSKQAADALGLPLIIGVLSNDRTEGKVRLYRRVFGPEAGAFWWYGPKTGSWEAEEALPQS
jgi:hypothetical protein